MLFLHEICIKIEVVRIFENMPAYFQAHGIECCFKR